MVNDNRKANMKPFKGLLGVAVVVALLGAAVIGWQFYSVTTKPLALTEPEIFEVKPGASLGQVANDLKERGLIAYPRYLTLWGRLRGAAGQLHVGEYRIEPGMTALTLLDQMVKGQVLQYSLTLVEGWSFKQMMEAIRSNNKLQQTLAGVAPGEIMAKLGAAGEHPEGRFYPDTYNFPAGMSDLDFLKRAYDAMAARLEQEWSQREKELPYSSPYEALIMASIIERETAVPEERDEIAGVFVRRLQQGMRLQTDPTVIYGMGDSYDGDIRRNDLLTDTPYNTYTRAGLPPTPSLCPAARRSMRRSIPLPAPRSTSSPRAMALTTSPPPWQSMRPPSGSTSSNNNNKQARRSDETRSVYHHGGDRRGWQIDQSRICAAVSL